MNTKHTTYEMQLLILCTKVSLSPNNILSIQHLSSNIETSYQTLIKLAYKHAVVSQLYHHFKSLFPEHPITLFLKPYYLSIVQRNIAMCAELIKVTQLFESHQIPTLCFKGPALATLIYGNITLRQYGDVDILIKKQDKEKAIALLETKHFYPEILLKKSTKKMFFDAVNVLGFQCSKKSVFMEIHWELLSKNYAIEWEEANLWDKTQSVSINQKQLKTLGHTNHFLYLCTHGSKHLYERLSWVSDIDHYIQTQDDLDWEDVLIQAKKLGISRMLHLSLHLTQSLLQTPLPQEVEKAMQLDIMAKKLAKKLTTLHFSKTQQKGKNIYSFKLLWDMREKTSDKLRFALYALFATKLDDFRFIQLPNYLAFLYPLVRPLRLIIKYLK